MLWMIERINQFLRKTGIVLNFLNIFTGLIISIAYVYIPIPSLLGLILGVIMAASGAVTLGISYYFTTKNVAPKNSENERYDVIPNDKHVQKYREKKNSTLSTCFLCIAVPCLLINAASGFFGMYTGTMLLASALGLSASLGPVGIFTAAIVLASVFTAGSLINSWLQTYNVWEGLRTLQVGPTKKRFLKKHRNFSPQAENDVELDLIPRSLYQSSRFRKPDTTVVNTQVTRRVEYRKPSSFKNSIFKRAEEDMPTQRRILTKPVNEKSLSFFLC